MARIRIMHVVGSLGTGGAEEGVRKLLSGLDAGRFEQIVCTVAPSAEIEPGSGARVVSLSRPVGSRGVLVRELARIFRRERPQIVHSRNWGTIEAVPAARLAGINTIIHSEHGLDSSTLEHQPWRRNLFRRFCFRWLDCFFVVSEDLRGYYSRELRLAAQHIRVMPNGVDTNRFRPNPELRSAARLKLNTRPATLVVGAVGRLDPVKDHSTLLRAVEMVARRLPIQLVIVGAGPQRSPLEDYVRSRTLLAKSTLFVGETNDVPFYLNGFDVFALPSRAEGMSNALLEAMAVEVTPVASRVGGNRELIDATSGLLFDAGNAEALAGYLEALALDPDWRRSLGANARKRVNEHFSLPRMLANYTRLYTQALEHRSSSPIISKHDTHLSGEVQPVAAEITAKSIEGTV